MMFLLNDLLLIPLIKIHLSQPPQRNTHKERQTAQHHCPPVPRQPVPVLPSRPHTGSCTRRSIRGHAPPASSAGGIREGLALKAKLFEAFFGGGEHEMVIV